MNLKSSVLPYFILAILLQFSVWSHAQQQSPLDVALRHIEKKQKELGLSEQDIKHFRISDLYTTGHNGVTHIYLNQTHNDIKVFNAIMNINILASGEVLNIGNRFVANLNQKVNSSTPAISPAEALQRVMQRFEIDNKNQNIALLSKENNRDYIFEPSGIALEPIKVNLVYQLTETKEVRLAWMVQLYQLDAQHWWNARVDAQNGEILNHHDQVIHCNFDHPDGKCSEHNHQSSNAGIDWTHSQLNEAFLSSTYNVFPMPVQSPNHGNRELVSAPANTIASPFGWHDTDASDGPEFTITRGNNVHAYQDIFANNFSLGDEPDGGPSLDFDFPLDLSTGLPYTQIEPAVVNLFYWNNITHDLWYQYGFDEVSGNFQANNYGNGGISGDWVRAEALDGGGTNNANFGTAEDGSGARMQMFIWTNQSLPQGVDPVLIVNEPASIMGEYPMQQAAFGGALPDPAIISEIVLVDDAVDVGTDACQPITNGADITGKIALIDRGSCEFGFKILSAENEGAVAAIICNNLPGDGVFPMGPGADGGAVSIPSIMISFEDCEILKAQLPGVLVELGAPDFEIPLPGPSGFDGDFDNGIIVHEYGHGISIRLTGGPSTGACLFNEEQAGEGWSDWFALVQTTTAANTANEARGIGTYAIGQPVTGGGIRQFPYSRSMQVNPHTYGDVPNVAVPHGVGSVWCAMIWDLYWNLVDEYGFDSDIYNGTGGNNIAMQLVIDGLKLQQCNPSFVDSRNAILAADEANYAGANQCLIWETFARRGLGFSASAGGNEAFDIPDFCIPVQVFKTAPEEIIAGETITYTLEIKNNLANLLSNVAINDVFPTGTSYVEGSLSCPDGEVNNGVLTINVANLEAQSTITCTYQLEVDETPFSSIQLEDDVENGTNNWTTLSPIGNAEWDTNTNSFEGDLAWFAPNIDSESDQYLTLSVPLNLPGDNPALSFWHWYDTEASWDGGVIEISPNNGNNWLDLGGSIIQNGYNGLLQNNPASPISGRPAFNGNSGGYIQSVVDLTMYSGQDILIRFRLGCDGAVGANGWYVDNIRFFGDYRAITNTACVSANGVEDKCDEATTVVLGSDISSTNKLESQINLNITPNPNNGKFTLHVDSPDSGMATLRILSIDGRTLTAKNIDLTDENHEFDLSGAASGVYFLQISSTQGFITRKIVIK